MNSTMRSPKSPRTAAGMDADMIICHKELCSEQAETLGSLQSIWADMGVYGEAKSARLESFRSHVSRLYRAMVEEEENNKLDIVQRIEHHMQELSKLKRELSGECGHIPEHEDVDKAPLYQVEKCLREKWEKLKNVKQQRIEELDDLQRRHEEVQYRLGKKDILPYTGGITEFELEAFKCRVTRLEEERDRLQASYEETRVAIQQIYEELEMTAVFPFEKSVLSSPVDSFVLSSDNMAALKKLHQTTEQKLSDARDTATELRERLSNLWERLQISADHRERFLHAHRGYSNPTISALKQELKRCEELKRANIENFVVQLRDEIVSWWDRCCYSEKQRKDFRPFYYSDFNEDVLELHEMEVNKLKTFYETNRDIYQLAEQRSELWDKMLELEDRANDPNRLFNNRGGQLLREERERNTLSKTLPKIEKELKERLLAFEQENCTPFLIHGERLFDLIERQNEDRSGLKELQKHQKKVTRSHLLEVESKLGTKPVTPTSFKRGARLAPPTPSMLGSTHKTLSVVTRSAPPKALTATLKRKADVSPHSNVSKKSKGGMKSSEKKSSRSGNKSGPRFSTSKIRRYGKGPTRMNEPSSSKTRRNIMTHIPADNCSIASGIGPYSEFQSGSLVNSSVLPCSSLTESARAVELGEGLSELCCAEKLLAGDQHTCFNPV
ncbi:hypothetical protein ONE63_010566 [Megalurothrips usitatus]|uniref:Protein regulator of cytokinesis 1-like n=1 Tax=Megalurothrips usitatus TaxID=439358 RepID=A0AAV7XDA8_9NEOP|nr:hypothetical protein ONE63_010566 [Megalurothrips usitatus]